MFALISPNEKQGNLYRVAEVSKEPFDVASPLFWVEAPQEVSPSTLWGSQTENVTSSHLATTLDLGTLT